MRVDVYVRSSSKDGALAQSFFVKSFEWSSAPPKTGERHEMYIPINEGCVKGVITDVEVMENSSRVLLWTETPTEDLRDSLIPDGWKEVLDFLE